MTIWSPNQIALMDYVHVVLLLLTNEAETLVTRYPGPRGEFNAFVSVLLILGAMHELPQSNSIRQQCCVGHDRTLVGIWQTISR
jgi:hypothetical protein